MRKGNIKINNIHIQNFIEERGIRPVEEDYYTGAAIYKREEKLLSLLDSYDIRYIVIPNKDKVTKRK